MLSINICYPFEPFKSIINYVLWIIDSGVLLTFWLGKEESKRVMQLPQRDLGSTKDERQFYVFCVHFVERGIANSLTESRSPPYFIEIDFDLSNFFWPYGILSHGNSVTR